MNPYNWSRVSTDLVFGRDRLLGELLSGLPAAQPVSFALTGGRRMGKTTVLRTVERELVEGRELWLEDGLRVVCVYIDGLSLSRPLSQEGLWGEIYVAMLRATNPSSASVAMSFADFQAAARSTIEAWAEAARIVVLFDEIEPLLLEPWCDGFFANWRALLSNSPGLSGSISAVFSGARELVKLREDVGSPLMDVLEFRSLRNLSYADVVKLCELPITASWSDDFHHQLFALSGGQPMLVQYLMQAVCNREKADDAIDVSKSAGDAFITTRGWQFNDWWYKYCTPIAQKVYVAIASSPEPTSLQSIVGQFGSRNSNMAVEILQHVGIVVSDESGLNFEIAGDLFKNWQSQFGAIEIPDGHDPRLYTKLKVLNEALAQKYASAWSILDGDHPNYSGAVSEMRDSVTLVLHTLAPDEMVTATPGFTLEKGVDRPTRRQRTKYVLALGRAAATKSLPSDIELLVAYADQFATFVNSAYGVASALTHTTAPRDLAYQALKQGDSILAQLLG